MIKTFALAAALAGAATVASAETLTPIHNATVDLGTTQGSAYYVVTRDGYHLVATLMSSPVSTPVRFDTVLGDGQSATVSIPGPAGTNPHEVTFTRTADHLLVRHNPDVRSVATQ